MMKKRRTELKDISDFLFDLDPFVGVVVACFVWFWSVILAIWLLG